MNLFLMTEERQRKMENILSIVTSRIESIETSLELSEKFIQLIGYSELEGERYVNDLVSKLGNWKLDHDVLLTICFRNDNFLIGMHSKEERGWYSEKDVPSHMLLKTINNMIEHFSLVEDRSHSDIKEWYKDKVILLEELKSHYKDQLKVN